MRPDVTASGGGEGGVPKLWIILPPLVMSLLAIGFYFAERLETTSKQFVIFCKLKKCSLIFDHKLYRKLDVFCSSCSFYNY